MSKKRKVAGYVKLAKLWEKNRETAIPYHHNYYLTQFGSLDDYELVDVFIDITGNKQIIKRQEMVKLLKACKDGRVNCIATQTRAYLAADTREFCYLYHVLHSFGVDIITEDQDYNINTTVNAEQQVEELLKMSNKYISLNPADFDDWKMKIIQKIDDLD